MRGLVAPAPVGRLATVRSDGRPHVVPICFVVIDDVVYSAVDDKPKRHDTFSESATSQRPGLRAS